MTYGSLFAGVGGLDLGLERAGLQCRWQVELDPFARRVLEKHWPDARRHDDVRTFPPGDPTGWSVDLICGGFPCQDISAAGLRAGINGERSGLWTEYRRVIGNLRPRYVLIENVADLLIRGLDTVLCDLASLGFDAEWTTLSAAEFGAHHIRQRLFVLAYSQRKRWASSEILHSAKRPSVPSKASGPDPEQIWMPGSRRRICRSGRTLPESAFERMDDGFPTKLDKARVKGCGNAVVPDLAEFIGRLILQFDSSAA
jgi:DNA (cytosine-5)-methyltransferase 1